MKRWVTVTTQGVAISANKTRSGWVIMHMSDWSQADALERAGVIRKGTGGPYLTKEWAEKRQE